MVTNLTKTSKMPSRVKDNSKIIVNNVSLHNNDLAQCCHIPSCNLQVWALSKLKLILMTENRYKRQNRCTVIMRESLHLGYVDKVEITQTLTNAKTG